MEHGEAGVKLALRDVLLKVYEAIFNKALEGDMQACKLLLDRVCEAEPQELTVTTTMMTDTERAARLKAILEDARTRMPEAGDAS